MAKLTNRNGVLYLGDDVCQEVGWNCAYLLARRWYNQNDTEHIRVIDALAAHGVRVIRALGMPTAPGTSGRTSGNWDTWGIPPGVPSGNSYTDLSSTFYTKQREILDYCEAKGISVIVTLMGRMATLADLKGETQSVGFGSTGSATRTFARTVFAAYVNALKDHAAVAAWEINNEWNNYAELNALPGAATGSPSYTDPGDKVSVAQWRETMIELATTIKQNDSTRAVLTGNAGPWNTNRYGLEGYAGFLAGLNPDPFDTTNLHFYSVPGNNLFAQDGFKALSEVLGLAKTAAKNAKKPLVIGEIGVKEDLVTAARDWAYLARFLMSDEVPQLTLLWNFYPQGLTLPESSAVYDCFPGDPRAYQVEVARAANVRSKPTPVTRSKLQPPSSWLSLVGGQCVYGALPITFAGPFTIAFWARFVNARDGTNFGRVLSTTSNESSNGFVIPHLPSNDEPYFRLFNGSGGQSATTRNGKIRFNKWTHFAFRFTPGTMTLETFYNGFQATSDFSSFTGSWVAPTGNFVIGGNYANGNNFKGQMAQVTLADRALTDEEVFGLACGVAPTDAMQWIVDRIDDDLTAVGSPVWESAPQRQMKVA